jgi:hypothetical protein
MQQPLFHAAQTGMRNLITKLHRALQSHFRQQHEIQGEPAKAK